MLDFLKLVEAGLNCTSAVHRNRDMLAENTHLAQALANERWTVSVLEARLKELNAKLEEKDRQCRTLEHEVQGLRNKPQPQLEEKRKGKK